MADLPKIMPGETIATDTCLGEVPAGVYQLQAQVIDPRGSGRTMTLPLKGGDKAGIYTLGTLTAP
jgi:hypothetical protein